MMMATHLCHSSSLYFLIHPSWLNPSVCLSLSPSVSVSLFIHKGHFGLHEGPHCSIARFRSFLVALSESCGILLACCWQLFQRETLITSACIIAFSHHYIKLQEITSCLCTLKIIIIIVLSRFHAVTSSYEATYHVMCSL